MNIVEAINNLKSPGIYRDINYAVSGLFLLVILDYLYRPDINSLANISQANEIVKFIVLFTVAYFFSRFCHEIGVFVMSFIFFFLNQNKKEFFQNYQTKLQKIANKESTPLGQRPEINEMAVQSFINENDGLNSLYERIGIMAMQERIFLGFSVLLSLFFSPYVVFIVICLVIYALSMEIYRDDTRLEIGHFFWLKEEEKKNSNTG